MKHPLAVIGREREVSEIVSALTHRFAGADSAAISPSSEIHAALMTHGVLVLHGPPGIGATTLIQHLREQLPVSGQMTTAPMQVITLIPPSVAHDTRALLTASVPRQSNVPTFEPGRINEDLTPDASSAIATDLAAAFENRLTVILIDQIERYPPPLIGALSEIIRNHHPHVACIITTHQPFVSRRLFGPSDEENPLLRVVPLRPLGTEDLWEITQSVIRTQVDSRSSGRDEHTLKTRVSEPGVTAHFARLMGEAHLHGLSLDAHLLLSERLAMLSPQAVDLGIGIALWERVLPITGSFNERRDGSLGKAQAIHMARDATGLTPRRASKALRELQDALILDAEGRCADQLWSDLFLGLAPEHLLERYQISLADAVAKRSVGSVTDAIIIAELLSDVRTPPIQFSPWLKTAARALMTTRADTSQKFLHALMRCSGLSDPEIGVATAMLVQTRVALGFNDLRSQVSASMMEEFITDAPPPDRTAVDRNEGPTRYDAFALVMAGRLDAARSVYEELALRHKATAQPDESQIAPDLLLEHASVSALAGDLNVCRELATEVWTRDFAASLRAGAGAMIVLADTTAGRWDMACQMGHEVIDSLGEERPIPAARYQPWLFASMAQIHGNQPQVARTWLQQGREYCAESKLAWAVPAHDALLSHLELRTGHLDRARHHARAALQAGPEMDGLGAANWAFATLLHLDFLNLVDPTATLLELSAWEAPVQAFGSDQIQRVRSLIDLSQGRVESAYLRMERLWHLSCDRELWVVISETAVLTAHLGHLCGRSQMVTEVILRLEDLWQRSGRSNVMVWCNLEIVRGLSEGKPARAERAVEFMCLEQFALTCAEAWSMVSQQWAHIAMSDKSRLAANRSAQIYNRIGAHGWARQIMSETRYR
jgi:hypothetical protein